MAASSTSSASSSAEASEVVLIGDVGGTNTRLQLHSIDSRSGREGQPRSRHSLTGLSHAGADWPPSLCGCVSSVLLSGLPVKLADHTYPSRRYSTLTDAVKEFLHTVSLHTPTLTLTPTTPPLTAATRAQSAMHLTLVSVLCVMVCDAGWSSMVRVVCRVRVVWRWQVQCI